MIEVNHQAFRLIPSGMGGWNVGVVWCDAGLFQKAPQPQHAICIENGMADSRCCVEHHRFTASELQLQPVIAEMLNPRFEMQQERFHIAQLHVVFEGMVEQRLQRVGVLLFHHGSRSGQIQTVWISVVPEAALQLVSTDARQLFASAQLQRPQHP